MLLNLSMWCSKEWMLVGGWLIATDRVEQCLELNSAKHSSMCLYWSENCPTEWDKFLNGGHRCAHSPMTFRREGCGMHYFPHSKTCRIRYSGTVMGSMWKIGILEVADFLLSHCVALISKLSEVRLALFPCIICWGSSPGSVGLSVTTEIPPRLHRTNEE